MKLSLLQTECSFLLLIYAFVAFMHLLSSLVSTSITSHIGFPEALVITKCPFPEWPLWVPTDLGQGGEKALD